MSRSSRKSLNVYGRACIALTLASCLALGCEQAKKSAEETPAPKEAEAAKVGVYTVKTQSLPLVYTLPGRVIAKSTAEIRPQIGGLIAAKNFEGGQYIHKDDVLYEIDSDVYKARVEKAEATLENAQAVERRCEELRVKQAVSEQDYENAVFARKTAEADLKLAQIDLEHCTIKSPINGVVAPGFEAKDVGTLAQVGQASPLTTVQEIDPIKIEINPAVNKILPTLMEYSKEASAKRSEQKANNEPLEPSEDDYIMNPLPLKLVLGGGYEYDHDGTLSEVDSAVNEDVGTVKFRGLFPNPDNILLPGMFVQVKVETSVRDNAILIPQDAVFRNSKGDAYVWVVGADSTTQRRDIVTSITQGSEILVDSGLEANDRVVVEGAQYVFEGAKVEASEKTDAPAPAPAAPAASAAPAAPKAE